MNRAFILLIAFVILKPDADAQPSITSFSPGEGSAGTLVTISGTNFSAVPSGNKVYFGAVAATVISASRNSLRVSVPVGTTYKPITVTVNGLTAYSNPAFKMLFPSCMAISTSSFGPPISFSNGDGDVHSAIGDLDGDGKADIVFTTYALSVIRNTSSPGSLSFAEQQNFSAGNSPFGIALGDLDGDGKLDVAITNLAVPYTMSVYKNTSTPGNISFASRIDYRTDENPYSLAIIDCDLDGRPDIVVTNQYSSPGSISVFHNTGSTGVLSLGPRVNYTCGDSPRNLEAGDIDGDGKPEIITANQYSQTISIFKNISKPGSISYAPRVDIAMAASTYPESIALGDLNGDNKPDLAVANNNDQGTITILVNTSSAGTILFASPADFAAGRNPFRVCMEDLDGDGKTDIAVTNQLSHDIVLFKNSSNGGGISFAAAVGYPLGALPRPLSIGDFDGDGKPELAAGIGEVVILKNRLSGNPCDLGPDLKVCSDFSYTLHAGPGYRAYQWQDGSTDSIFTVHAPGVYFVTATDYCDVISRDTVNVIASPEFVSIGNDTATCKNDTLTLTATAGFSSYSWSPGYNLSSMSGQTVKVFPGIDTTYKVTAVKNTGCAIDSIKIRVYPSASISPGNDTSFCSGTSVTLSAGPGFMNYLWNTGARSQQIKITDVGQYTVSVKDGHGCTSNDTVNIISVYQNPSIHLQKDTTVCHGSVLDAGNGFINYLWQDGTTSQTYMVNYAGRYQVTVTDNHQCKGSDSVEIKQIIPSPSDFIIKDTAICEGQTIVLKPSGQFANYSWSTGEITSQINITSFGNYWLEVSNNSGCRTKDSINVSAKNCKNVYFPNAFTPNRDGTNEIFKAIVFGALKNFHLAIYNHFGQKMFETNDRSRGWNGQYKGRDMDTGAFVWYSEYQFNNELLQKRKGVVILIR